MIDVFDHMELKLYVARFQRLGCDWRTADSLYYKQVIPFTRIYFPVEGGAWMRHSGQEFTLRPGHLYLLPAHIPVDVECDDRLVKYWTHFQIGFFDIRLDMLALLKPRFVSPAADPEVTAKLFDRLVALAHEEDWQPPGGIERMEAYSLLRLLLLPFFDGAAAALGSEAGQHKKLVELLVHIEKHLDQPLTLEVLARQAHLHPGYLSNWFARHMGQPLIQYCNNRRIRKAVDLIWEDQLSFAEIARRLGGDDPAAFSRLFKRHLGTTPSAMRKNMRKSVK